MDAKIVISFLILCPLVFDSLGLAQSQSRIVGGNFARESQFPWHAAIVEVESGNYICNGFIINELWIGTTAFCVSEYSASAIESVVGTVVWRSGGTHYRISEIVLHNSFIPSIHLNDVAALKTTQEIVFTGSNIQPSTLGAVLVNPAMVVTQSSFGKTSHLQETVSDALIYINLQVLTNSDCQARLFAMGHDPGVVFDTNFCTFNEIGQGSCHGDAGSPIIINNQIVGFNSWDEFCGLGSPDIHVRMSSFRTWYLQVTDLSK